MDKTEWLTRYNDRTERYAQRHIDAARTIAITCDIDRLARFDAQVALLTAANLFGRMSPNVVLAFGDRPMHAALPWAGESLHAHTLEGMRAANPFGTYAARPTGDEDFSVHFGRDDSGFVFDGLGWNAYCGFDPSPLPDHPDGNAFGAALAVVLAAAQFFRNPFAPITQPFGCNALDWNDEFTDERHDLFQVPNIGHVHFVGLGSVGTATIYYLTIATRRFTPTLIDKDRVKIHNLTRSPVFLATDCADEQVHPEGGIYKVVATKRFLEIAGVSGVEFDPVALHDSRLWSERPAGTPDIVVSAANEDDVRYHIEMGCPPIQLYATTGKNWQVALLRHRPGDACSMCVFPPSESRVPMACATDHSNKLRRDQQIDAALPFLSFGAGLMTAAEIMKLSLTGYPFCRARVSLNLRAEPSLVPTPILHRQGCSCEHRDRAIHKRMIAGSRYATF